MRWKGWYTCVVGNRLIDDESCALTTHQGSLIYINKNCAWLEIDWKCLCFSEYLHFIELFKPFEYMAFSDPSNRVISLKNGIAHWKTLLNSIRPAPLPFLRFSCHSRAGGNPSGVENAKYQACKSRFKFMSKWLMSASEWMESSKRL